jgi:hypothetical protein
LKEREVAVKEQGKPNDNTTPVQQGTGGNQPVLPEAEQTLGGIGSRGPRPQGIPTGEA